MEVHMRTLLVATALAAAVALTVAAPASAGCMATVKLSSLPHGTHAGQPWQVRITVLQHGRTPMADARPRLSIRREDGGKRIVFHTRRTARTGVYAASVV